MKIDVDKVRAIQRTASSQLAGMQAPVEVRTAVDLLDILLDELVERDAAAETLAASMTYAQ